MQPLRRVGQVALRPRVCDACGGTLLRCDEEVADIEAMEPAEREAWLDGEFGYFGCVGCGDVVELVLVGPPRSKVPARVVARVFPHGAVNARGLA